MMEKLLAIPDLGFNSIKVQLELRQHWTLQER